MQIFLPKSSAIFVICPDTPAVPNLAFFHWLDSYLWPIFLNLARGDPLDVNIEKRYIKYNLSCSLGTRIITHMHNYMETYFLPFLPQVKTSLLENRGIKDAHPQGWIVFFKLSPRLRRSSPGMNGTLLRAQSPSGSTVLRRISGKSRHRSKRSNAFTLITYPHIMTLVTT